MAIAQNPSMQTCTHDRGPGTTVCLHCRYEARVAAQARRRRLLFRFSAIAIIIATLTAGGVVGATAIRGRIARPRDGVRAGTSPGAVKRIAAASTNRQVSSKAAAAVAKHEAIAERPGAGPAPLVPVIPIGQSTLAAGVVAARTDSLVLVSFDAPMLRTRMPVKFESFVRSTLPAIYGPAVDTALAKLADGDIARQGDLLTELPGRGVHIPLHDGWTIAVFPETRPGHDGPLVIRYRVSVIKG